MPKEKKTMKLRDQKPAKDPRGGDGGKARSNSLETQGGASKNRGRHRGHSRF
jgi:hypothetical protein